MTNLEVKSNLETRALINSKVPGLKYKMLCTYLFLTYFSLSSFMYITLPEGRGDTKK